MIEDSNLSEEKYFLSSKGFINPKQNFKKPLKFNGYKDLTLETLIKKNKNLKYLKEGKQITSIEETEKKDISIMNQIIVSEGITHPNIKVEALAKKL